MSSASVRSLPFLSFIVPIFAWNVPLVILGICSNFLEEISSLSHFIFVVVVVSIVFLYFCQVGSLYSEILLETPRSDLFSCESTVFVIFKDKIYFYFVWNKLKYCLKSYVEKTRRKYVQILEMDADERWNYGKFFLLLPYPFLYFLSFLQWTYIT